MNVFRAVLVLLGLLSVALAQQPWRNCGSATDKFQLSSVTFTPNPPTIGGNLRVSVSGVLKEVVVAGTAKVTVVYSGSVPIFDQTLNLCTLFPGQVQCPIQPGANGQTTLTVNQALPSFAPAGEYSGQITLRDQNGAQLACVAFDVHLVNKAEPMALDDDIIEKVNKDNLGWTAGRNKRFEGVSLAEAKKLLGAKRIAVPGHITQTTEALTAIPDSFDARQQWPECIHPIRNQEHCGSCWAFSAAAALSDRFCIASAGKVNVVLSPQDMVSCDSVDYGCEGGYLNTAWNYLVLSGIVQDSCLPYTSGNGNAPPCPASKTCADGKPWQKYYAKPGSVRNPTTVSAIQTAIMTSGPVQGGFMVYQDFMSYTSGVYTHRYGQLLGGHAIKIVGWGVSNGTPYWIVANSWGTSWGQNGYFWIKRGSDECGIEDEVYYGEAKV